MENAIKRRLEVKTNYGSIVEQKRYLKRVFKVDFDFDKSGLVDKHEFVKAAALFNCFGSDAEALFDKYNALTGGDGSLSYDEFAEALFHAPDPAGQHLEDFALGPKVTNSCSVTAKAKRHHEAAKKAAREAMLAAEPGPWDSAKAVEERQGRKKTIKCEELTGDELHALNLENILRSKIEVMCKFGDEIQQKKTLINLFKKFDRNSSGSVDKEEFCGAMETLNFGRRDALILFNSYDEDKSGELSYGEFICVVDDKAPKFEPMK